MAKKITFKSIELLIDVVKIVPSLSEKQKNDFIEVLSRQLLKSQNKSDNADARDRDLYNAGCLKIKEHIGNWSLLLKQLEVYKEKFGPLEDEWLQSLSDSRPTNRARGVKINDVEDDELSFEIKKVLIDFGFVKLGELEGHTRREVMIMFPNRYLVTKLTVFMSKHNLVFKSKNSF